MERNDIVVKAAVEAVTAQSIGIADNQQFHASPCDCHIHAAQVAQKSDVAGIIASHKRNDDYITFLPLEPIDSIDLNQMAERLEERHPAYQRPQILHLSTVG